jgi:hypothetical protein
MEKEIIKLGQKVQVMRDRNLVMDVAIELMREPLDPQLKLATYEWLMKAERRIANN